MSTRSGIDRIDHDLLVLDAPRRAGVLMLHPDRMNALFTFPVSSTTRIAEGVNKDRKSVV